MAEWHFSELESQMVAAEERLKKLRKREKEIEAASQGILLPPSPASPRIAELEKSVRNGERKRKKLLRQLNRLEGSLDYLLDERGRALERTRTLEAAASRYIPSVYDTIGGSSDVNFPGSQILDRSYGTAYADSLVGTSTLASPDFGSGRKLESEYRRNARLEMTEKRTLAESLHRNVRASSVGRSLIPLETQRIFAEAMSVPLCL